MELDRVNELKSSPHLQIQVLDNVYYEGRDFPIHGIVIGDYVKGLPTFGLFGGVHGLERVGTHVILHFLESLSNQLDWDKDSVERYKNVNIVCIPMVNPVGVHYFTRGNHRGVDLMRNAPVESDEKTTPYLIGGHRISPKIPWYRGKEGSLEIESKVLIDFNKEYLLPSPFSMALDIHSGFGFKDYLWYPYAKTKRRFPLEKEALSLGGLLEKSYPHHVYTIESQSLSYTCNGDLWDYLFDINPYGNLFLPWTLEMGSWTWIKKNPRQLFSLLGPFNPIKPHRHQRIMRRHYFLIEFFIRATMNYKEWCKI